jgi:L-ascorbate 6-phosphate lactonase
MLFHLCQYAKFIGKYQVFVFVTILINYTNVPYGTIGIWFLGQESVILKGGGITIYIDPFLSDDLERNQGVVRMYEPPLMPDYTRA